MSLNSDSHSGEPLPGQDPEALIWTNRGIPVLPCGSDRVPLFGLGVYGASGDEAQVRRWWGKAPFAMIAVPLGEQSGILVLDIDCHTGRPNGFKTLEQMAIDPATLSPYWEKTPRGGAHHFYRFAGERNATWPGIELRGSGLYVVTWPSGGYAWQGPQFVDPGELPELPEIFARGRSAPAPAPMMSTSRTSTSPVWILLALSLIHI